MKAATVALVLAVATLAAGCGARSSSDRPSAPSSGPVASATSTPTAGLVGRWERVTTCQELVRELDQTGLGPLRAYAWLGATSSTGESSFAPGSPKPTRAHPCTGALPRVHSHFFTQSGQFGSLDWLGGQVDEDPYRIVNDTTVRIGSPGVALHYRILHGTTLMLAPVLTKAMVREALADPKEFSAAGWAVSMAYPGHRWKRVPCQSWC
jgi:hypothetical protein